MILKTNAICIKNTRYGETSVISKMYCSALGLCAFIVQGVNRKTAPIKPSHLLPGNILELVVYQKPHSGIQRIKELRMIHPLQQIHTDIRKNAVLQFMLEIFYKSNEELHPDEQLYAFLQSAVLELEHCNEGFGQIPFAFLTRYLAYSGWHPNIDQWEDKLRFNLQEGRFEPENPLYLKQQLDPEQSRMFYQALLFAQKENEQQLNNVYSKALFGTLLAYFELHVLKGKPIKSPAILKAVFS